MIGVPVVFFCDARIGAPFPLPMILSQTAHPVKLDSCAALSPIRLPRAVLVAGERPFPADPLATTVAVYHTNVTET